jgi:transcriptional antiterminator NusG
MAMRWYVIHAYSGFEKSVMRSLIERINLSDFSEQFDKDEEDNFLVLVPTESVTEMREGRKYTSERKLYPGYVLIKMEMNDDTWHLVKEVPKVLGFIGGTKERPASITNKEADIMLQRIQEGAEKARPKVLFEVGELVRIKTGPFANFSGTVEEINYEKSLLRVAVSIFGRSTPVEIEFSQVEKE